MKKNKNKNKTNKQKKNPTINKMPTTRPEMRAFQENSWEKVKEVILENRAL
jgi:hypothetical protein